MRVERNISYTLVFHVGNRQPVSFTTLKIHVWLTCQFGLWEKIPEKDELPLKNASLCFKRNEINTQHKRHFCAMFFLSLSQLGMTRLSHTRFCDWDDHNYEITLIAIYMDGSISLFTMCMWEVSRSNNLRSKVQNHKRLIMQ